MTRLLFSGNRAGGSIARFDITSPDENVIQCAAEQCDEPYSVSVCVDANQIGPAPLGTDSFIQAIISWGSPRAGVRAFAVDCGSGARVTVEGATTITANIRYVRGAIPRGPAYAINATLTLGRAGIIVPNTCTVLPLSLAPAAESAPAAIPRFSKLVRIVTNQGNTFPASVQGYLRLYRSALDAPATALRVAFENNVAIAIPAGCEAFSIENRLGIAAVFQPVFDLLLA